MDNVIDLEKNTNIKSCGLIHIRGIHIRIDGSRYWNKKSLFALIVGYGIGILLSELHNYSYMPHLKIQKIAHHLPKHINDIGLHNHSTDPNSKSSELYEKVKILCWVMTNPENHKTKAIHVLKTWGKRCNKILLMSSVDDDNIDEIIALPVGEGRDNLWAKTKKAFTHIYDLYFDEYDWFLKADDDTYVTVENLRLLLHEYDPWTPIYFGYKFAPYVKQGYMSGGGGYVLSKEALRRFIEIAIPDPNLCYPDDDGDEDVEIGLCLENVQVIAGDSRDKDERGRFFIFCPEQHLLTESIPDPDFWYWEYMYYKTKDGLTCCSDYAISFHYIEPELMYILDFLIYHAKPYGIVMDKRKLNHKSKYTSKIPEN